MHGLPAGVLWGTGGATPGQCAEMLDGLVESARICARLGLDDHAEFIEACRWRLLPAAGPPRRAQTGPEDVEIVDYH